MQMSKKTYGKTFVLALALLHSSGGVVTGRGVYQRHSGYTQMQNLKPEIAQYIHRDYKKQNLLKSYSA